MGSIKGHQSYNMGNLRSIACCQIYSKREMLGDDLEVLERRPIPMMQVQEPCLQIGFL